MPRNLRQAKLKSSVTCGRWENVGFPMAQKQAATFHRAHSQPLNRVSISEKWKIVSELLTGDRGGFVATRLSISQQQKNYGKKLPR